MTRPRPSALAWVVLGCLLFWTCALAFALRVIP